MSIAFGTLIVGLLIWMALCAWCGYGLQIMRFLAIMVAGLALKVLWLAVVMRVAPLDPNAVAELLATVMYGLGAFGCGYLVGRIARQLRDSHVETDGV